MGDILSERVLEQLKIVERIAEDRLIFYKQGKRGQLLTEEESDELIPPYQKLRKSAREISGFEEEYEKILNELRRSRERREGNQIDYDLIESPGEYRGEDGHVYIARIGPGPSARKGMIR